MKYLVSTLIVALQLAGTYTPAVAAAPDPVIGSWRLNLAKSRFPAGRAPQSQFRTYAESAEGTTLTFSGVAADGSPAAGTATFQYDGRDYPMTGAPFYDTLALTRMNSTTAKSVMKKGGKVVGTTLRTVSDHGQILTMSTDIRDARGVKTRTVAVYERQPATPPPDARSEVR